MFGGTPAGGMYFGAAHGSDTHVPCSTMLGAPQAPGWPLEGIVLFVMFTCWHLPCPLLYPKHIEAVLLWCTACCTEVQRTTSQMSWKAQESR